VKSIKKNLFRHRTYKMRSSGFTLIELLIVVMMMSIFTALIVPSMATAMRNKTLAGTGKNICELLEFARMSAIARHRPATLNIDSARGLCWVSMNEVSLPWLEPQGEEERPETRMLATIKLPEGTECNLTWGETVSDETMTETEWNIVTYQANGTTDDVFIELSNLDEDEPFRIHVYGTTGEVHTGEEML
jgi:type II secretion system protein H